MKDPIVIDPPNFNQQVAWDECRGYVEKCGGLIHDDGETNWRATFVADPGICSCPACGTDYWCWGRVQKCVDCGFEYPTDWWSKYSSGASDGLRISGVINCPDADTNKQMLAYVRRDLPEKMKHPYYRHAFENPPPYDPSKRLNNWMEYAQSLDWRKIIAETDSNSTRKELP